VIRIKTTNWKTVAEFAGMTGILLGLYFVYAELQLNSTIARTELNVFVNQSVRDLEDHFSDPDFVSVYLTGLDTAEELTAFERRQLSEFYESVASIFGFEYRNYMLGIFVEYEELPRILVRKYMTGQFAQAWWALKRDTMPEAVKIMIDDEIAKSSSIKLEVDFDSRLVEKLRHVQ
jgi:hypothetical protein